MRHARPASQVAIPHRLLGVRCVSLSLAPWPAVAQAGPAACLVRGVVLEVAVPGGAPADGAGAGRVPDLGQMPQPGPGVVAAGLVGVLAVAGVQGVDRDDQVQPTARGAQPPGAVPAGRPSRPAGVKQNPVPPGGGPGPARFRWLLGSGRAQPWPTAWPCSSVTVTHHVVFGFRAAARTRSRASHGSPGARALNYQPCMTFRIE
jgi:hypothetical protein